jgi:hypothetical protein
MNLNYATCNSGVLTWDGTATAPAGIPVDVRNHVGFAFTFEVIADLTADTIFDVKSAPPSANDSCLPGTFVAVPEVLTCSANFGVQPGPQAKIMLPNGTKKGSICTAALPCKPDAFVTLAAAGGDTAKVRVVTTLHGPM